MLYRGLAMAYSTNDWHCAGWGMKAAILALFACILLPVSSQSAEDAKTEEGPTLPVSEDGRIHPIGSSAKYFSDLGRGGYTLYEQNCSRCHGHFGEGVGHAPGLISDGDLEGYKARRRFHREFERLSEPHGVITDGTEGGPEFGFNQLEIIAKYLRELGQWVRDTGDSGTSAGG